MNRELLYKNFEMYYFQTFQVFFFFLIKTPTTYLQYSIYAPSLDHVVPIELREEATKNWSFAVLYQLKASPCKFLLFTCKLTATSWLTGLVGIRFIFVGIFSVTFLVSLLYLCQMSYLFNLSCIIYLNFFYYYVMISEIHTEFDVKCNVRLAINYP